MFSRMQYSAHLHSFSRIADGSYVRGGVFHTLQLQSHPVTWYPCSDLRAWHNHSWRCHHIRCPRFHLCHRAPPAISWNQLLFYAFSLKPFFWHLFSTKRGPIFSSISFTFLLSSFSSRLLLSFCVLLPHWFRCPASTRPLSQVSGRPRGRRGPMSTRSTEAYPTRS